MQSHTFEFTELEVAGVMYDGTCKFQYQIDEEPPYQSPAVDVDRDTMKITKLSYYDEEKDDLIELEKVQSDVSEAVIEALYEKGIIEDERTAILDNLQSECGDFEYDRKMDLQNNAGLA